jgi:hypothetical protein
LWQIIAATLVALLVSIPLELKIFSKTVTVEGADLGGQIIALGSLFSTQWYTMIPIALIVVIIYQIPIFVRMSSED